MGSRKKSAVWAYFEICPENNRAVVCLLCRKVISRGGTGKAAGK